MPTLDSRTLKAGRAFALVLALLWLGSAAWAQNRRDEPTAYQEPQTSHTTETHSTAYNVGSAICWYLPNRIMDVYDIFKLYGTVGDGNGIQLRATKYMDMTWVNTDVFAAGFANRESIGIFGESRDEKHFGFLAAQEGKIPPQGDPTEVGFALHFVVVGAHLGVSLAEAADCVTGIFGIDLMNDDHGPVMCDYAPEAKDDAGQHPVPEQILPPEVKTPVPADEPPTAGAEEQPGMPQETATPAPAAPAGKPAQKSTKYSIE